MTFTTEKVRVPEGMTNLTCFDYMQFKFDFANLDIHLCHWVHKHQSSNPGFPGTVSSHPFQAWKWSCCQTTSLQTKIKMNLLSPFATEALWVFSILCLQTALASCFYVCLHNCSNFLRGEIWDICRFYSSKSLKKHAVCHKPCGRDRSHSCRNVHMITCSPKEVVSNRSQVSQTFQRGDWKIQFPQSSCQGCWIGLSENEDI